MNIGYLIIGVLLLATSVVDLLWTTLWVDGRAGPISAPLTSWMWRGMRAAVGSHSRAFSLAGPLILILTLFMWITLLWAGWVFLFAGDEASLMDTRAQEPVTWTGRIYFIAYTMFTMGNGDFSPRQGFWQIATALTTASGMLFVTLAVSYVISVLEAVSQKRVFASTVIGLGKRSEDFVRSGWDGTDFHALDLPLSTLTSQLSTVIDQHRAYPILNYYHSSDKKNAATVAVAILDEALTLLCHGVPPEYRPNPALLRGARAATGSYLQTLNSASIRPVEEAPPPPDLDLLRTVGVPTADEQAFAEALDDLAARRRELLGMVQADARSWPTTG